MPDANATILIARQIIAWISELLNGIVKSLPVLKGLHHEYRRAAWTAFFSAEDMK